MMITTKSLRVNVTLDLEIPVEVDGWSEDGRLQMEMIYLPAGLRPLLTYAQFERIKDAALREFSRSFNDRCEDDI